MYCLAFALVALLCEAGAKEEKCKAIFGTPYKDSSDIEDGVGGVIPFFNAMSLLYPTKLYIKEWNLRSTHMKPKKNFSSQVLMMIK